MAGNATTSTGIDRALLAQATYLKDVIATITEWDMLWDINLPDAAALDAVAYPVESRPALAQHRANLKALLACVTTGNVTTTPAHDMRVDIGKLRGIGG